jgi:DNA invertase Pin-like site-specific DNA recombinase
VAKETRGNGASGTREVRCAIYTRKSSEDGLEQDFNSLDAQREACEAYIRSQRGEGWVPLPQIYDDGGFSGGSLERPALRRLLGNIEAASIDTVVVYKVDRLTRSLSDFAKIVEVFDARGVSFVSVTQQFNTTTSMGRLTLNMLLSFAQFEREVTGERIRDKIAASKRRGMWMGGLPPLGYDVRDRKLLVNEPEAKTVQHIFRRYAELGSVLVLKTALDQEGILSKLRLDRFGRKTGGKSLARGALYLMLQNRLYRGEIGHKDKSYPGEHEAIIDEVLWEAVQTKLATNRTNRRIGTDAEAPSLLAGLLFDARGERMSPTHTRNNKGTRYRYYISQALIKGRRAGASNGRRVPAGEVENFVEGRFCAFLQSAPELSAALEPKAADAPDGQDATEARDLIAHAAELGQRWKDLQPSEKRRVLLAVIERVNLMPMSIEIRFRPSRLASVLDMPQNNDRALAERAESAKEQPVADGEPIITWSIPARLKCTGIEKRLLVEGAGGDARRNPDHSLARLLAQGQQYHAMLMRGDGKTMEQLGREAGVTSSYFTRILRLSFLAPVLTRTILRNSHPIELTAKRLANEIRLPADWTEQRVLLGIA